MPAPHRHMFGPGAAGNTHINAQASRGHPNRAAHDANGHATNHQTHPTRPNINNSTNTANSARNNTPNHHHPPTNPARNERTNATTEETTDVNINTPRERREIGRKATMRHEPPEAADRAEWHPQQSPVRGGTRVEHAAFFSGVDAEGRMERETARERLRNARALRQGGSHLTERVSRHSYRSTSFSAGSDAGKEARR